MIYCPNCGTNLPTNANLCSNCGVKVKGKTTTNNTAKIATTVAGMVIGASLLGRVLFRPRRPFIMSPHQHYYHGPKTRRPMGPRRPRFPGGIGGYHL